jgi:hypothetical protein
MHEISATAEGVNARGFESENPEAKRRLWLMSMTKGLGVIAARRLANTALIDGDPTKGIRDFRSITTVLKGGKIYDPAAIEKALSIAPRQARP